MDTEKEKATAALVTKDGQFFFAKGFGHKGEVSGEIAFTTAAIGYQEIITNPINKGKIMLFTCPHIGNVGINAEDSLSKAGQVAGIIVRDYPTSASNYRAKTELTSFLEKEKIVGICELDTRALLQKIRSAGGRLFGIIAYDEKGIDVEKLKKKAMDMKVD